MAIEKADLDAAIVLAAARLVNWPTKKDRPPAGADRRVWIEAGHMRRYNELVALVSAAGRLLPNG